MDLKKVCRACLTATEPLENMLKGENIHILETYMNFTQFQVEDTCTFICLNCADKLANSYEFLELCRRSEDTIKNSLVNENNEKAELDMDQIKVEVDDSVGNLEALVENESVQTCNECDFVCSTYEDMVQHVKFVHSILQECYGMDEAPEEENGDDLLNVHTENMEQESESGRKKVKDVNCSACGTLYEFRSLFGHQKRKLSAEKQFTCHKCSKDTYDKYLLPERSSIQYERKYQDFKEWSTRNNKDIFDENTFLLYFQEKSQMFKRATLWSMYSMLKATFMSRDQLDISKFSQLLTFIKKGTRDEEPRKTSTFTKADVHKFLTQAPNWKYLLYKVVFIFGLAGGCRMEELRGMTLNDIRDLGHMLLVSTTDMRTRKERQFPVTNDFCEDVDALGIFREYMALRPALTPHRSLFVQYLGGKCTRQPVGIHSLGRMPKLIALNLKLPNAEMYTGHSFRKTSSLLFGNTTIRSLTIQKPAATTTTTTKAKAGSVANASSSKGTPVLRQK